MAAGGFNRFGGGFNRGFNRFGGGFNNQQQDQQEDKHKDLEFVAQGNQNAAHLIQGYPHLKLVEFILSFASVNVNQQDYIKRTPIHCFIENNSEKL